MESETILVTGSGGQIGSELVLALSNNNSVIASDIKEISEEKKGKAAFVLLDVMDKEGLRKVVKDKGVTQIYHLAAILSATGEHNPKLAWDINMTGLQNILDVCVEENVRKLFFPSSIAVFGPTTPRVLTPQYSVMEPNTIYGISKQAGERWCDYYFQKKGLDVRSIRYPGLISYKTKAGGGTTDYAVDIFFKAVEEGRYECFLSEDTTLPMLYMPDAIKATIQLMEAPAENIKVRSSYNLAGFSFSPKELAAEIQKVIPDFKISYAPDFRQQIADSWPQSIEDDYARNEWNWQPEYDLPSMVKDMIENIRKPLGN